MPESPMRIPMVLGTIVFLSVAIHATDEDRTLKVIVPKTLPAFESISIYSSAGIQAGTPEQVGSDYRVEMPAPEGFYAVWLVPANGARAQRIEDRIRVLPGKIVRIGN